jgi:hypothetical protein
MVSEAVARPGAESKLPLEPLVSLAEPDDLLPASQAMLV